MRELATMRAELLSPRFRFTLLSDGSGVLFDGQSIQIASLNDSSAFILEMILSGASSPSELAEGLARTFDVDQESAREDVLQLLDDLSILITTPRREPRPDR